MAGTSTPYKPPEAAQAGPGLSDYTAPLAAELRMPFE